MEWLTQPAPFGLVLLLFAMFILSHMVVLIHGKRLDNFREELDYKVGKATFKHITEGLRRSVDELQQVVNDVSETNWDIEDDVERLLSPWWKKLLRKIAK